MTERIKKVVDARPSYGYLRTARVVPGQEPPGERVQVAFSLDCCDRELMSYVATTAAITGEMIRDLMAESVERRFGAEAQRTPQPVEWLSDNGPPYTAHETRAFGESLGLLICTTPAYSPESNGIRHAAARCLV